jgi:hypothetical protein
MPQLTYRQTVPNAYRVSADGVEIGSISLQTRHVHPIETYWTWGAVDVTRREATQRRCRDLEAAFTAWHAGLEPELWEKNRDYIAAGAERWHR